MDIIDQIKAVPLPNSDAGKDVALWKHFEGDYKPTFSASCTWEKIRETHGKVAWSKIVWFAQGVPRYLFIAWLSIKIRLSTGDRMRAWGDTQSCGFCGEREETHDHLIFVCP